MPRQRSFMAVGLALLMATATHALPFPFRLAARDPPKALPQRATANDLKFQPAMDFDTDSCYNTPAIGPDGTINPGLDHENTGLSSSCHDLSDLQNNNVYARARCNNRWCAYIYDYYFEKDVALANFPLDPGHRNDWEHIVVWAQDGVAKYVAASMHGGYEVKAAADVRWEGTHPKMVYHKDGLSTHAFRFGNTDDDRIENASGSWFFGALVSWNGFPSLSLRDKLSAYDFGSANFALKDSAFPGNLDQARAGFIPEFDINKDDGSPGNP
ncbi:necrosis inducing protein-domain-containing protein [Nemania sp. NC0429]|nr:necrosis inducing protein-domain-containing protein [Nemania sp. NC0429]